MKCLDQDQARTSKWLLQFSLLGDVMDCGPEYFRMPRIKALAAVSCGRFLFGGSFCPFF